MHILNDNLKIVAQKIDMLNEMMFDETSDLPENFTVQGYVHANNVNYTAILERMNTMEANMSNILQSVNTIVQSKVFTDEDRELLRSVAAEPGAEPDAKRPRTEE